MPEVKKVVRVLSELAGEISNGACSSKGVAGFGPSTLVDGACSSWSVAGVSIASDASARCVQFTMCVWPWDGQRTVLAVLGVLLVLSWPATPVHRACSSRDVAGLALATDVNG